MLGHNNLWGIGAVADRKAKVVDRSVVEVADSKFGELGSMAGADSMVLALNSILSGLVDVL